MPNLVLSINSNVLKLSTISKKGFLSHKVTVPEYICNDTKVIDVTRMGEFIIETASEFIKGFGNQKSKFALHFIIEPQDVVSEFATTKKNGIELSDQVLNEVRSNLEGVTLDELYYTHKRIAPFVHHFLGFRKADLEKYVELAGVLGIEMRSIVSWLGIIPKYVNYIEPSVIVATEEDRTVLALSELGGIYFSKVFDRKLRSDDLHKFIKELGNYERTEAVKRVFVLGNETIKLEEPLEVTKVSIPNSGAEGSQGFEKHLLVHYMLDFSPETVLTTANMLTLLPMPVVSSKSSVPVLVGSAVAVAVLLFGAIFWGSKLLSSGGTPSSNSLAQANNTAVLSEQTESKETTPSTSPTQTPTEAPKLAKGDLKIQLQNGAGVSGLAGRSKTLLESLGYKVAGIGDADLVGRQNTLLKFKKDKIGYKEMLISDIKDKYLDIVVEDDLDQKESYDLLIIIGTDVKGI